MIMQLITETPRTLKDLAEALRVSKQEVLLQLASLPVREIRTVSYGGRNRPVVITHYTSL